VNEERVGVLIGRQDLGETDRILRWLIPEEGRVSVVARGARRARSPFVGADLGVRARLVREEGQRDLGRLQSMEVEEPRVRLRSTWERLRAMMHLCEVISGLAREQHPEPRLFGLLETALLLLEHHDDEPGDAFGPIFEAKALTFAGMAPVLDRCLICGKGLEDRLVWVEGSGVAHMGCELGSLERVSLAWVDAVETGRRQPLKEHYGDILPPGPADLLTRMVEAQIGRPLGSRAMAG
jgi:DNA repair protein RecO (recombination protein O)